MRIIIITVTYLFLLTSCLNPKATLEQDKIINSLASSVSVKFKNVPTIEPEFLKQKIEDGSTDYILVDTRDIREQKVSMISTAISAQALLKSMESYRDKIIYTYSTIGGESSEFTQQLLDKGFRSKSLFGGTLMWAQSGYPFFVNELETRKLGIENEAWNILPSEYEGVFP